MQTARVVAFTEDGSKWYLHDYHGAYTEVNPFTLRKGPEHDHGAVFVAAEWNAMVMSVAEADAYVIEHADEHAAFGTNVYTDAITATWYDPVADEVQQTGKLPGE